MQPFFGIQPSFFGWTDFMVNLENTSVAPRPWYLEIVRPKSSSTSLTTPEGEVIPIGLQRTRNTTETDNTNVENEKVEQEKAKNSSKRQANTQEKNKTKESDNEHTKNKRQSTKDKHEKGQKRKEQKTTDKKRQDKDWEQNPNKRHKL